MKRLLPVLIVTLTFFSSCSHKKPAADMTAESLRHKTVALVAVRGPREAKLQTEVAIANDIIEQGRFQIIDKLTVDDALSRHPTEADWAPLGDELKADLLLAVDILDYKVDTRTGYDINEEEDSVLREESRDAQGTKYKKYYKVKAREGVVRYKFNFYDVAQRKIIYSSEGAATQAFNSREGDIPRQMKLLETLSHQAVRNFFENMPR